MRLGEKRKLCETWIGEACYEAAKGDAELPNKEAMNKMLLCCEHMEKEDRMMTKAEFDREVLIMVDA